MQQNQSALDQVLKALGGAIHNTVNTVFGAPIQSPVPEGSQLQPMGRANGIMQGFQNLFAPKKREDDGFNGGIHPPTKIPVGAIQEIPHQITPTPLPGQEAFVRDMMAKRPGAKAQDLINLYKKAVTGPGFSGRYYGGAKPNPSPTPTSALQQAVAAVKDGPVPVGIAKAMAYVQSFVPKGVDPKDYYPALRDPGFIQSILQADQQKPGIGNVLILQAFHESTLGRANNGNNIFGALPGGEGNAGAQFASPAEAVKYQIGPHMLGGGANPNMNVMGESGPLTRARLIQLYKSYNPSGDYIKQLLDALE